ncbi:AtpZ/AtpI family protein [Candidatus Kuenenbacteria bacterium]|nr:AtpZ/AtpI family protein [Candidatus Kuenenbacteria bacterium]
MDNKKNNKENFWSMLSLAWELGYLIALPLVIFALTGRFLDKYFHTSPWLFLFGILLAIIISVCIVYKKTIKMMK